MLCTKPWKTVSRRAAAPDAIASATSQVRYLPVGCTGPTHTLATSFTHTHFRWVVLPTCSLVLSVSCSSVLRMPQSYSRSTKRMARPCSIRSTTHSESKVGFRLAMCALDATGASGNAAPERWEAATDEL